MNKNALYFSLYMTKNNTDYYSMLYYAIKTLENYAPLDYDVVVFHSSPDIQFETYNHLEKKFNLVHDFPWVKFYNSDYAKNNTDPTMHKWYNLQNVFDLGYKQIFYLDCDVIFSKNPNHIFQMYVGDGIFICHEGPGMETSLVLGRPGTASGQWIIDSKTFNTTNNLFECIISKRKELLNKAYEILPKNCADWFASLSEQYAAQMALVDQNIKFNFLHGFDVNWGDNTYKVQVDNGAVKFTDLQTSTILHYLGCNAHLALPEDLLTENMRIKLKKYINEKMNQQI